MAAKLFEALGWGEALGRGEFSHAMMRQLEQEPALSSEYPRLLFEAAKLGRVASVKKLIELGADLGATDQDGWTPLHCAAAEGHLDVMKELIDAGAPVNQANNDGDTPLHYAAHKGHLDAMAMLQHYYQ